MRNCSALKPNCQSPYRIKCWCKQSTVTPLVSLTILFKIYWILRGFFIANRYICLPRSTFIEFSSKKLIKTRRNRSTDSLYATTHNLTSNPSRFSVYKHYSELWEAAAERITMANISVTTASENLIKAMNDQIIPNQEYLLQGSILDSAVEHLLHR